MPLTIFVQLHLTPFRLALVGQEQASRANHVQTPNEEKTRHRQSQARQLRPMSGRRFAIFITVVLTVWGLMHGYVFWRLSSIPWVAVYCSRTGLVLSALAFWLSYPLARFLNSWNVEAVGVPLEFVAAVWMGVLFLMLAALFVVDVVTAGGWLFPQVTPQLRGGAVLVAGLFSIVGVIQGLRPPVLRDYEVRMAGLPSEHDGLTLVTISDLHLGTLKGERWLTKLVSRVNDLKPDLVVVAGDLVDGNVRHVERLLPRLKQLGSPLGVWAVTGNHEYYAGLELSVSLLEAAGYGVLRDRWTEVAPGLIIAGVAEKKNKEAVPHHTERRLQGLSGIGLDSG